MTRLHHLTALRDKVKAGECQNSWNAIERAAEWSAVGLENTGKAVCAYNGSLDAAKALQEALLPGMGWTLTSHNQARILQEMPPFVYVDFQDGETPARAWLLAILSALMRKETEI